MRAVFSSFVAVSLLVHAAFGCCWHHVHEIAGAGGAETGQGVAMAAAHEHDDCLSGCESHDCAAPHSPDKEQANCHGICQYLPSPKTPLDSFPALAVLDIAVVNTTAIEVPTIATSNFTLALAKPSQPPVRLHLFQQLLLI